MSTARDTQTVPPIPASLRGRGGVCDSVLAPDNYAYRERNWRAPAIEAGEEVIFEEPGRTLAAAAFGRFDVDCRSHYFLVTRRLDGFAVKVRHGSGDVTVRLGHDPRLIEGLGRMESDERFRLLFEITKIQAQAARAGYERASRDYEKAFVEGRLRKRKRRGSDQYDVRLDHIRATARR